MTENFPVAVADIARIRQGSTAPERLTMVRAAVALATVLVAVLTPWWVGVLLLVLASEMVMWQ